MDGLDISVPETPERVTRYRGVSAPAPRRFRLRNHLKLINFLLVVVLPTAAVSSYFFFVAADQYVSEARFIVTGPSAVQSPGMLSSLLQTAGMSRATEDTYAVQDYMLSRDALTELVKTDRLDQVFARPEADLFSRFPRYGMGDSFEHFFKYYQSHVDVLLDTTTGVSELTVRSFRPEDSHRIAAALLEAGERLVNRMNDRQRENALSDARKEVVLSEQRVQAVAAKIAEFRNREALLDPTKQATPMLQSINELETMLSRTNLQITQMVASTPGSPLILDYRRRAAALQGQIAAAKTQITGTDQSLVPKITAFDLISLEREFADKQLASATASLEAARVQAERQQLYLEEVVQPNVSDYPEYPKRIASIAVVFVSLMGVYFLGTLLIAGAKEHKIV